VSTTDEQFMAKLRYGAAKGWSVHIQQLGLFIELSSCTPNSYSFPSVANEQLLPGVSHFLRNISPSKGRCLKFPSVLVNIYSRKIIKSAHMSLYIIYVFVFIKLICLEPIQIIEIIVPKVFFSNFS